MHTFKLLASCARSGRLRGGRRGVRGATRRRRRRAAGHMGGRAGGRRGALAGSAARAPKCDRAAMPQSGCAVEYTSSLVEMRLLHLTSTVSVRDASLNAPRQDPCRASSAPGKCEHFIRCKYNQLVLIHPGSWAKPCGCSVGGAVANAARAGSVGLRDAGRAAADAGRRRVVLWGHQLVRRW